MKLNSYLLTIALLLTSGNVKALTVAQLMELYSMGEAGQTAVKMHMSGIADAMLHTNAWDTVIADKIYRINDFRGVCFPQKQAINGNYLMDVLGTYIISTKEKRGIEAAAEIYKQELAPVLIEIFSAQNCPIRKIRDK